MAVEAVLIQSDASNANNFITNYTSPGFGEPDVVLFMGGSNGGGNDTIYGGYKHTYGWAHRLGRHFVSTYSSTNNSLSSTTRQSDNRNLIITGGFEPQGVWQINFVTDGITLTSQSSPDAVRTYPIYALLLKGIQNIYTGQHNMEEGLLETVNCGFRPGLILTSTIGFSGGDQMDFPVSHGIMGVGFASPLGQKSVCIAAQTNQENMPIAVGRSDNASCYYYPTNGPGPIWTSSFENYTDTSFDIRSVAVDGLANDSVYYIAMDFGDGIVGQILDGASTAGVEETLDFDRGSVILGVIVDGLRASDGPDLMQNDASLGWNHWMAYDGGIDSQGSLCFSNEEGAAIQRTRTGRWGNSLKGLSPTGIDVWTGTNTFDATTRSMGFQHASVADIYFMGVSFGTLPIGLKDISVGDIYPGDIAVGDRLVGGVAVGDELKWGS